MAKSRKKELPYKESDWFSVPLNDSTYALGLIARVGKRGGILLGYFFGPRKDTIHSMADTVNALRQKAVFVRHFCDPGLVDGTWPIIGSYENWNRKEWSQTDFGHLDVVDPNKAYRRVYNDNDPSDEIGEVLVNPEEIRFLPQDGLSGHLALQIRLSHLLSNASG